MDNQPLLRPASSRPAAAAEAASPHTRDFEGLRWARLGMAFGATINAGFSMLGMGLTIGWLACGPSYTGLCGGPVKLGALPHTLDERIEQIIPPALGIGLLQGVLLRRVTGTLGDETGDENAIALYMPINVSPRQAFQSLFAVAFGNVALAFPIFLGLASDTYTYTAMPQVQGSNPFPLAPTWCANHFAPLCPLQSTERRLRRFRRSYAITAVWSCVLVVGMWGWVNVPRGQSLGAQKSKCDSAATIVGFCALTLFGFATGFPTLCATNAPAYSGDNAWQAKLGYPDAGCPGAFLGHFGGDRTSPWLPDPSSHDFYTATPFWVWVAGLVGWGVLSAVGIAIQLTLLYRRAWDESASGETIGDRCALSLSRSGAPCTQDVSRAAAGGVQQAAAVAAARQAGFGGWAHAFLVHRRPKHLHQTLTRRLGPWQRRRGGRDASVASRARRRRPRGDPGLQADHGGALVRGARRGVLHARLPAVRRLGLRPRSDRL